VSDRDSPEAARDCGTSESAVERYLVGLLVGFLVVGGSIFTAMIVPVAPGISVVTGAAWAWCIGVATGLWIVPWAKQGVPTGGEASA